MKGLNRKREEGFSLVELMIAMAVMLIGFAASYNLFQLGYKYLNLGADVTQARQEIRMAFENMVKELQETSSDTITIPTNTIVIDRTEPEDDIVIESGQAISFASARYWDPDKQKNKFSTIANPPDRGKPNWQKAVVYFRDAESNTLYRYEENRPIEYWSTKFNPSLIDVESLKEVAKSVTSMVFDDSRLESDNLLSITSQGESALEVLTTTIKVQN